MNYLDSIVDKLEPEYLTKIIGTSAIVFLGYKLFKESKSLFSIKKNLNTNHVEIKVFPKRIIENCENIQQPIIEAKYIKSIVEYYNTVKKEMPEVDLTLYNRNIKTLKINEVDKISTKGSAANYDVLKNKITKLKKTGYKVLNHEFFHMSTSIKIGDSYFSGFSQSNENIPFRMFGSGLDDGYAALLDKRYFNYNNYCDTYEVLYIIAYIVELIVGKEKMEKLYFRADLYNLVETLKQYNSKESIIKFLCNLDVLLYCRHNTAIEKYYCRKILPEISSFLIKTYSTKQLNLLYNNKISEEEVWKKILFLIDVIDDIVELNNKTYKFSNISSVYETVSKLSHIPVEQIKVKRKNYEINISN